MRQIEPDPTVRNQLMMGPDGTVHFVPIRAGKKSQPSAEMEDQSAAKQQSSTDLPSLRDAGLHGIRRVPDTGICFSYSVPAPLTDRDAALQALQGIRRMPEGGVCFSY